MTDVDVTCEVAVPADGLEAIKPSRDAVLRLEAELRKHEQVELPVKHVFSKGLYARELFIPKGTMLTGKIHRHGHINIISQGEISVLTEAGMRRLKAPCTLVSAPGIKRAGYAHEDTVWTTIHATEETDLERIEAEFIVPDFEALGESLKIAEDEIK